MVQRQWRSLLKSQCLSTSTATEKCKQTQQKLSAAWGCNYQDTNVSERWENADGLNPSCITDRLQITQAGWKSTRRLLRKLWTDSLYDPATHITTFTIICRVLYNKDVRAYCCTTHSSQVRKTSQLSNKKGGQMSMDLCGHKGWRYVRHRRAESVKIVKVSEISQSHKDK